MSGEIVVVGIGADGWAGLGEAARHALRGAVEIVGSTRQLALLPDDLAPRRAWPSPLDPAIDALVAAVDGPTAVLASGDPMLHGIGSTLARRVDPARLTVHPHPSACALACARLGWPAAEVTLVSAIAAPLGDVVAWLQPGRRLVVYLTDAAALAALLVDRGWGPSRVVVMEELGGPGERITTTTADAFDAVPGPLHLAAVEVIPAPGAEILPRTPGLPDDAYATDSGQLTKRHLRALAVCELAPVPGALLWDVGAGAGSIAIEWLRAEPTARAVAIERDPARAATVTENARRLGAGRLEVVTGEAPGAFADLAAPPDRIFLGGGVSAPGMIDAAHAHLRPGGRLVAHAVTLESERAVIDAQRAFGGTLTRIDVAHAEPIGRLHGWRPQRPVVQWRTST